MMPYGPDSKDDDILVDAKEAFKEAEEAENENRERAKDDIRFARLGEQWPEAIAKQRRLDGRPMLVVPRLQTFIRQVVNDARQNKPAIKTRPVDSVGDPETAEIYNGIIRHIESNSGADIAYDTAIDSAVSGGFGYWRIGLDYAHDDTFDLDLKIERVADPFTVYADPWATSADGSDWNSAFVTERMSHARFEEEYPDADKVSWSSDVPHNTDWLTSEWIQVAEWWQRERVTRQIIKLSDGSVIDIERLEDEDFRLQLEMAGITPVDGQIREVPAYEVKQCILTDGEVLDKRDWPGKYIPIVPVYGDEVNEEGKRHFFSLIHPAKDAQRQLNYWRTAATEMIALAPRVPYIGPTNAFTAAPEKWATVNTQSHAFMEYAGDKPPQRQQLDASAIGPIQQAMNAQDDIKSILGQFDAALGARSNETSGRAILARQRESDVSTFHFIDNLTRSIRHSGRILIDLIPHVWPDERVVRLMNEDGSVGEQLVNGPVPVMDENGEPEMEPDPSTMVAPGMEAPMRPKMRVFSLTEGKYDLVASAGPSYTTKREEAASQMMDLLRAYPAAAPVIGDLLASNLDWPGADEIAKRLKAMLPAQIQSGIPPEIMQLMEEGQARIQALEAENAALKGDQGADMLKARTDAYKAETERGKALAELGVPLDVIARLMAPMSILEPSQPQPIQPQPIGPMNGGGGII